MDGLSVSDGKPSLNEGGGGARTEEEREAKKAAKAAAKAEKEAEKAAKVRTRDGRVRKRLHACMRGSGGLMACCLCCSPRCVA